MKDSVWEFPRPDHVPRVFQTTNSFWGGFGGVPPQAPASNPRTAMRVAPAAARRLRISRSITPAL